MWWATKVVKAIARLPLSYEIKAKLIRATPLAAAKYGTPVAHVGNASYCAFRAAVVDALGPKTTKRCSCRTFEQSSHGEDLDLEIVFSVEKNVICRRVLAKDPDLVDAVKEILEVYKEFGYVGIRYENTVLSDLKPAPPPGHPERHWWEPTDPELGPIGLMLSTLHKAGAALDVDTFTVHPHGEVPTSFLQVPYNHVKKPWPNISS